VRSGQVGTGPQSGGAGPYGPVFFAVSKKGCGPGPDRTVASLIMVHTSMVAGGRYSIYWLLDLARKESIEPLTIESLAYDQFLTVLREDIQFDTVQHNISHCYAKDAIVPIGNERLWKAAIVDLHIQGMERFMFPIGVEARPQREKHAKC